MTCDIVKSRFLKNRVDIQENLKNVISKMNHDYSAQIEAPFVVVWGDSFQGALKSIGIIYEIYESLRDEVAVDFRCGIGIGNIYTKPSKNVLEMDGDAYYHARFSLKVAKRYGLNLWLKSDNSSLNKTLNVLFLLLDILTQQWSPTQRQVITLRKKDLTYEEIGKKRGVTKQAIHKILKRAKWVEISLAKRMLASINMYDFNNDNSRIPELIIDRNEISKMTGYQFQHWISEKLGIISLKTSGDGGLEGILDIGVPCQIKKGKVGLSTVRDFASVLNDLECNHGIIIGQTFSPSAKKYSNFKQKDQQLEIQLIEIKSLNKSLKFT
jgi:predicted DNA-binding protein YlxM (UPF0122 family)